MSVKRPAPPTVAQILDIPNAELSRMKEPELRTLVNVLVSAGNKRIRRLERNAEKGTIATEGLRSVQKYSRENGWNTEYFSAKGKDRNQLYKELARARRFFNDRLSTVEASIEERKRREKRMFGETREERAARLRKEAYNRKRREERAKKRGETPTKEKPKKKPPTGVDWREIDAGDWDDFYNSPDYDPVQQYKNMWEAFRYFLAGFGKEIWKMARDHGFMDSETIFSMISGYFAQGFSPREAGEKVAELVSEQYNQWEETEQEFYDES